MPTPMDPEMTILPKGIVVNTKQIYDEIAGHDLVPKDRVWEIWRGKMTYWTKLRVTTNTVSSIYYHHQGASRPDSAKAREFLVACFGQRSPVSKRTDLGEDIPRNIFGANCRTPERTAQPMGWRCKYCAPALPYTSNHDRYPLISYNKR